jgi:endoglucanase
MDLLQQLTQTPSVPGREERIRTVIQNHITSAGLFDEVSVDPMGSLLAVRHPRPAPGQTLTAKPTKVLLMAHMDQIGFLVRHIDEQGYLRVNPAGGFDARNLFARTVRVCTADGDIPGIMNAAGRPIHLATEADKKKIPEVTEFFVDCGLAPDEVKRRVRIGDMIVLDGPFHEVGHSVVSQCLDNRVGCWALIRAIENLTHHSCEIHAVWSVQEEVGMRGAGPAAFRTEPDIAVSCDTTLCCKTPGIPDEERVSVAGEGVCLHIMDASMFSDMGLVEDFERVAQHHGIRCQRAILARGGQDGAAIQRSRSGVRTICLACPVKYIHTIVEMTHRDDLHSYHTLLTAWLQSLS